MVFGRRNYILMIAGVLAILVGFIIMRLENEVDGFISLYVAPVIIQHKNRPQAHARAA